MNNLIMGRTWEEIQGMQQKAHKANLIHRPAAKPTAKKEDIELLKKHGVDGLTEMQFFGVIDRLQTSGLLEDPVD